MSEDRAKKQGSRKAPARSSSKRQQSPPPRRDRNERTTGPIRRERTPLRDRAGPAASNGPRRTRSPAPAANWRESAPRSVS